MPKCCVFWFAIAVFIFFPLTAASANKNKLLLSSGNRKAYRIGEATFKSLLTSVSDRFHITIIAEDEPLKHALPINKEGEVVGLSDQDKTAMAAVQTIAEAFDYSVEKQSKNLYLLRKRFSAPGDLPCVTLEEWNASVADIVRMADAFSPKFGGTITNDPRTKIFAQSLSAEQLDALKSANGLSVEAMSTDQQRFVRELCLGFYVETPLQGLIYNLKQSNCISNEKTTFGWFDRFKKRLFGYEGPLIWQKDKDIFVEEHYFRPLNHLYDFYFVPNGTYGERQLKTNEPAKKTVRVRSIFDKVNPDSGDIDDTKPEKGDIYVGDVSEPLGEVVSRLNPLLAVNQTADSTKVIFSVDPELAEKRVTLVGNGYTSPFAVFQGLATVYGLRIHTKSEGKEKILIRYRLGSAVSVTGLWEFIRKALPDPFLRFAQFKRLQQENGFLTRSTIGDEGALVKWRTSAVKRLRATLEPRLEKNKKEQIAFPELLASERIALANILMSYHADEFTYFIGSQEIQDCLTAPETVVLTGGLLTDDRGKPVFSLLINTRKLDGRLRQWACYQCLALKKLGFNP